MKNAFFYDTAVGQLGIAEDGNGVTDIFIAQNYQEKNFRAKETPLIAKVALELSEYFRGERKIFSFPLDLRGSAFQSKVWLRLTEIPYGKTVSYKDIALGIDNPKACRAVGMANHNNPIMIVVPCHRVIGSDGSLTGYAGGLHIKKFLLELEKKYS